MTILLGCVQPTASQTPGNFFESGLKLKSPFTIRQFSNKDGLPQNEVFRILQLKDRSLILSTALTPVAFNGYDIHRILPPTEDRSFYNMMWYHQASDQVWAISNSNRQIHCLYPEYKKINLSFGAFASIVDAGDSMLLISRNAKVYSFQPRSNMVRPIFFKDDFAGEKIVYDPLPNLVQGSVLYLNTHGGVFAYDLKYKSVRQVSKEPYNILAYDPFNKRILGVKGRSVIDVLNNEKILRVLPLKQKDLLAFCITFKDKEQLFIGTNHGICFFYDSFEEYYDKKSGLPSEYIHSLYYDQAQNSLFAGTGEKGLLKLQFKSNYSYSAEQGYRSAGSITQLNTGETIIICGGTSIRRITNDSSLGYIGPHAIFACLQPVGDELYAGTWGEGVKIYRSGQLVDSICDGQLGNQQVLSILKTRDGTIWLGTVDGLSAGKNKRDIRPVKNIKLKGEVVCLYELRDGTLCAGTTFGAYFIRDNETVFELTTGKNLHGIEFRCFYEDPAGRVWMGSYGQGLYVKDGDKVTALADLKNCMLDKDAFCLAPDGMGYLYITSNHGLWRIKENSLYNFYERKTDYLVPFYYGEEEGILNTEFNGGFQNNYFKSKHNHFFFPSIEGMVKTVPEKLPEIKITPRLDAIYLNDTIVVNDQSIFPRSTNSIRFEFSCTNLSQKNNIYFQHKLLGSSSDRWSEPQRLNSVSLRLLPPGHYKFVVRVISGFNDTYPPEISFVFSIKPYFYETSWFMALAILFLITATTFAVMFRNHYQRNKEAEKERYSRQMAELELKAIQAQLNPHFVFNCLNTIKSLILLKDFEKANEGLNTFSSLTREMLENSDKIFMPLQQNLKFCKNYIELEKMRLQDHFSYSINVDPAITDNPVIPHLLIQPYIENAIKHGIAHLEGKKGVLEVTIEKTEKGLICHISDNGIGRLASMRINAKRHFHVSKGTTLTVEKSAFLKTYMGYNCEIIITDLYDENKSPAGTEVQIIMPFTT